MNDSHAGMSGLRRMLDARSAIHAMLTAVMAWLSVALQMPGDTFVSPAWAQFARLGTEEQWAYWFMAAAFVGTVGLITDRRWIQRASVFLLSTAHMSIAWCFYLGPVGDFPITTGVGTYGLIAALGYYLLWRRFVT